MPMLVFEFRSPRLHRVVFEIALFLVEASAGYDWEKKERGSSGGPVLFDWNGFVF